MRIAVHAHSKPNFKLKKCEIKLKLMYLIPQFYLYNSQLPSYCTKNKVTIKPKYKENFLLHERTKKSTSLYVFAYYEITN